MAWYYLNCIESAIKLLPTNFLERPVEQNQGAAGQPSFTGLMLMRMVYVW